MATKVTFELAANIVAEATSGILVGEFNNWDFNNGISLKRQKDGSMKASVELENGKTYEYRYFLNDGRWVNDDRADRYSHVSGYNVENCIVSVPAIEKAAPVKAVKAETKKEEIVATTATKVKAPAKAKAVKSTVVEAKAPAKAAKKATAPKAEATPAKKVAKKAAK
jgi:hypothetical protein